MATAVTVVDLHGLAHSRTLAVTRRRTPLCFSSSWSSSKMGFYHLQQRTVAPLRKRLIIRAARTESQGVSLGFRAPNFELPEPLTGKMWKLEDFESHPALLEMWDVRCLSSRLKLNIEVMFICNHCPFVKHLKKDIVKLANFYTKKGLAVVAISSNSVTTHPQDGPQFMAEEAKLFNYPFPYLFDKSQDVAWDFEAVCTPEFFLFKKDGRRPFELVYHGQFDDSRPSNNLPVTGRDICFAIECVLSGQPISSVQKPSVGCSIKWHTEKIQ
ncbi:hypothetical protein Dsin_001694 [Dipteronia sinensis]|uniref:Thioredoxin domain-containing protein n=1 Tax=Dipteronia sinensis TaxID=43782 RepID=A0AAE0B4H2_9ROSI|nr:hypothetical protein Dsin_001694 [Dipteronia sinensis]